MENDDATIVPRKNVTDTITGLISPITGHQIAEASDSPRMTHY